MGSFLLITQRAKSFMSYYCRSSANTTTRIETTTRNDRKRRSAPNILRRDKGDTRVGLLTESVYCIEEQKRKSEENMHNGRTSCLINVPPESGPYGASTRFFSFNVYNNKGKQLLLSSSH